MNFNYSNDKTINILVTIFDDKIKNLILPERHVLKHHVVNNNHTNHDFQINYSNVNFLK